MHEPCNTFFCYLASLPCGLQEHYTHLQKAACVSIDLLLFCLGLCAHMIIYRCINLPVARAAASSCRQCGTSPQLSSGWPCIQMCAPGEISACWYSHANGCEERAALHPESIPRLWCHQCQCIALVVGFLKLRARLPWPSILLCFLTVWRLYIPCLHASN